jgi:hypothetical protein
MHTILLYGTEVESRTISVRWLDDASVRPRRGKTPRLPLPERAQTANRPPGVLPPQDHHLADEETHFSMLFCRHHEIDTRSVHWVRVTT